MLSYRPWARSWTHPLRWPSPSPSHVVQTHSHVPAFTGVCMQNIHTHFWAFSSQTAIFNFQLTVSEPEGSCQNKSLGDPLLWRRGHKAGKASSPMSFGRLSSHFPVVRVPGAQLLEIQWFLTTGLSFLYAQAQLCLDFHFLPEPSLTWHI